MTDVAFPTANTVSLGEALPKISIPLTLQRLVMEAGANRDFSFIHHDREVARSTGAPDTYANTFFLMGLFERQLREWIGPKGRIRKIGPMQMLTFNCVGDVLELTGQVSDILEDGSILLEQEIKSERGITTKAVSRVELA